MQDSLAQANNFTTVFEPLHPKISRIGERYAYRRLTEADFEPELLTYLLSGGRTAREKLWVQYRILSNKLVPHADTFRQTKSMLALLRRYRQLFNNFLLLRVSGSVDGVIVKMIRANLMVPWLERYFTKKIIYLIRDPESVVASQYHRGESWHPDQRVALIRQNWRLNQIHSKLLDIYSGRRATTVEKLAILWVIENSHGIADCIELGIPIISYEDLKEGNDRAWRQVCSGIGLPEIPKIEVRSKPSMMALPTVERIQLSSQHIEQVSNILELHNTHSPQLALKKSYRMNGA